MKPIDVKSSLAHINFLMEDNEKDPKLKVLRFGHVISDLNGKEISRTFYEKE